MKKLIPHLINPTALAALIGLLAGFSPDSSAAAMQPTAREGCEGCIAEGGGFQMSGCSPTEYVKITVMLNSGECSSVPGAPSTCEETPCVVNIQMEWQLASGTTVGLCLKRNGLWYCQFPPPTADGSVQTQSRTQFQACNDQDYTYQNSATASCGDLVAEVMAKCTECLD